MRIAYLHGLESNNLGPKNDWKKSLDLVTINKIEKAFKKEMKELGYL